VHLTSSPADWCAARAGGVVAYVLNFAVWAAATVHGMGAGTDRSAPWLLAIDMAAIVSVLAATTWRALRGRSLARPARLAAPAVVAAVALALALPLALGPLRFRPRPWNAGRFTDALDGRIVRQLGSTRGLVSMAGQGSGPQRVLVRADLLIAPDRLLNTAFQMECLPSGATCAGHVTSIDQDGLGFQARCRLGDGRARSVTARWADAPASSAASGSTFATSIASSPNCRTSRSATRSRCPATRCGSSGSTPSRRWSSAQATMLGSGRSSCDRQTGTPG
jgi:hypothetical protein